MRYLYIVVLLLGLTGCINQNTPNSNMPATKNGTYSALAQGYGGEFKVDVVFKDDQISDIYVKEHNETPSIGGVAIEQMIAKMKEKNSYQVDIVSGATRTSNAIIEAVKSVFDESK